jgi:hypothetical protein
MFRWIAVGLVLSASGCLPGVVLQEQAPAGELPPVTDFSATSTGFGGALALTWANPIAAGFDSLQLLRRDDGCPVSAADTTATLLAVPGTAATITDPGLIDGTEYCYAMFAVYGGTLAKAAIARGTPDNTLGLASQILVVSGDGQTGTVGEALLAPFVVTVKDEDGRTVPGFSVTFTVTGGGGSLSSTGASTSVPTDGDGEATLTLTLGTLAGENTVEASIPGAVPVVFTATGVAGAAYEIVLTSGDGQTGPVGSPLAEPFVVTVTDARSNPVNGVTVSFLVTQGEGNVPSPSAVTNEDGQAETTLTLGPTVGVNTLQALAPGLAGSPLLFNATSFSGAAGQTVLTSGNNQTGIAGAPLAQPFVVTVLDSASNPVADFTVVFAVTSGGGNVVANLVNTNAEGQASTTLTLGTTAGTNTVQATGPSGSSVVFTATGVAGPATQILGTAGDEQSAAAGVTLPAPFVVTVSDVNANPVAGFTVAFFGTSGGGQLSVPSIQTNAQGQAQTTLTLGTDVGTNTVQAHALGLVGSPVVFTATGLALGFAPHLDFSGGGTCLAITDLNEDGKLDLAVASTANSSPIVSILFNIAALGAATPAFAARVDLPAGPSEPPVAPGGTAFRCVAADTFYSVDEPR